MKPFIKVLCVIAGYLIGSIPWALIIGKVFYNTDVREYGSGNLGATNAGRVLGKGVFYLVTVLDATKALIVFEIVSLFDPDLALVCGIATVLGLDESLVIHTISDMEQEQIICGYNTVINWDKTDDERVTALIEVKVTPQRGEGFDRVAERIYNYEEVTSLYLMSGGFDMTVFIEGKTMKEVAQFVARKLAPMEGVLSTSTHFVLKKYKESGTKLEQQKKDERLVVTA